MKIEHIALYVNDLEEARNFFLKQISARIFFHSMTGHGLRS